MGPLIATFILVVSLGITMAEDDEPFSIGLGVLSPSYAQTVGKDEKNIIKVNFQQKEDGVSYTITDPQTGSNSYYNFGGSAGAAAPAPEVVKELQADQFSQTIRAHQPQAAYNEPQGIPPPPPPPSPIRTQQPASFAHSPVDYAQPPPAYAPPPAAYGPPPAAYAPPPAPYAPPPAAYAPPPTAYAPPPAEYAPPPVQHVNPVFFNNPHAPAPQPGVPVVVQYNSMHSASPAAVPFNSQPAPAPAIFSYRAIEGQRYANQATTSNLVMAPAPVQAPLAPLPYQAGPLRDFGYAQQSFFLPQAPSGFIQGFQVPAGGSTGHGYGQVFSPGVGQYTIQNRNHGGHTAEDVAALKQQKVE